MSKSRPMSADPIVKEKSLFEKFVEFVNSNTRGLFIAFIAILVGGVFLYLYLQNRSKDDDTATQIYDVAVLTIEQLRYVTNEQQRGMIYVQQVSNLNGLIQQYPDATASLRARLYIANLYIERAVLQTDLDNAQKNQIIMIAMELYQAVNDKATTDFYRALGTLGLAYCYELNNQIDMAIAKYQTVIDKYGKEGFTPYAMIGMAQNLEIKQDVNGAINLYRQVADNFTNSQWKKYAKAKIYSNPTAAAQGQIMPVQPTPGIQLSTPVQ